MKQNNQNGAAVVETAIILPLLLIVLFGILEFGRVMYIATTLNNAAREGARRAAVSTPPLAGAIDSYVRANCVATIPDPAGLVITTSPSNPTPGSGQPVTVTVTLPFQSVTRLIPVLDGRATLTGEATMRYER